MELIDHLSLIFFHSFDWFFTGLYVIKYSLDSYLRITNEQPWWPLNIEGEIVYYERCCYLWWQMHLHWSVGWPVTHGKNADNHVYTTWEILMLQILWTISNVVNTHLTNLKASKCTQWHTESPIHYRCSVTVEVSSVAFSNFTNLSSEKEQIRKTIVSSMPVNCSLSHYLVRNLAQISNWTLHGQGMGLKPKERRSTTTDRWRRRLHRRTNQQKPTK